MSFQVQVTVPYFSGVPSDVMTNVWHFQYVTLAPGPADWVDLATDLTNFYNYVYAGIANRLTWAPYMRPADTRIKAYNLIDPTPRAPVYDAAMPLSGTPAGSTLIPPEAAVVASFQGDRISGTPQARRRGRVFLGGIGAGFTPAGSSAYPTLGVTTAASICTAMENLSLGTTANGWTWQVWSRVSSAATPVTNGWVDNAIDTQRRRGNAPTVRSTWS